MPLTATIDNIKAYQEKVEKNKITSDGMLPCSSCNSDAQFFKVHAYRERRFLLIVETIVKAIFCTLVRFKCPNCGKTITNYPDFALPYKHYTRQTIENFSKSYVDDDHKTYEDAVMTDDGMPEWENSGKALSPSTIHRWITTMADIIMAYQALLKGCPHKKLTIPRRKYNSPKRKNILLKCRFFFRLEAFLNILFSPTLKWVPTSSGV
ncbi:MAG TPA: hypothetical protein DCY53_01170 [Desulfobacteraceae bacterium]|nr:hypothetical protein [Desulfobacteraceae bacterium]